MFLLLGSYSFDSAGGATAASFVSFFGALSSFGFLGAFSFLGAAAAFFLGAAFSFLATTCAATTAVAGAGTAVSSFLEAATFFSFFGLSSLAFFGAFSFVGAAVFGFLALTVVAFFVGTAFFVVVVFLTVVVTFLVAAAVAVVGAHDAVTEFQLAARDIIIEKVKIERDEVKKKCFCAELVHSIQELVEWILTDNDINTRVGLVDFLTKRACTSASNEFDRHSIFNDADHPFFPSARRFGDRSGR